MPFYTNQQGLAGKILGGWQVNSFFTIQSGAPFTVLNGADPAGALNGIDGLVGSAIRANINTTLDVSSKSIVELRAAGFLNQWATNGGNRRIIIGGRIVF